MANVHEINQQREALKKAYPNAAWAKKVNLMSPEQVTAIYLSKKRTGEIK